MMWFFVIPASGVLVLVDRWLKTLAVGGATRDLGFVHFVLFKNDALVFSWPAPNSVAIVLMIIAIAVVLLVIRRMWKLRSMMAIVGCVLILGGAMSNLYDRLAYGYVIDWAYLGQWWPVFNLADVMVGVGLMLILLRHSELTQHHNDQV